MDAELKESIDRLSSYYTLQERMAVEEFLYAHPTLVPLLEESIPHLEKHFPESDVTLALEVDEDEDEPGSEQERLFVLISVPEEVQDAQARLEKLDNEWAIDMCEASEELIVVDLSLLPEAQ